MATVFPLFHAKESGLGWISPRGGRPGFERSDSPPAAARGDIVQISSVRCVSVTRNGSLAGETIKKAEIESESLGSGEFIGFQKNQHNDHCISGVNSIDIESDYPFFIDWITIEQTHFDLSDPLPKIIDGYVQSVDADGEIQWRTERAFAFEGSYDSRISVRCDGLTVRLSGNLSRFGRRDNLFGYGLPEIITTANNIISSLGLPPFTEGRRSFFQSTDSLHSSGAKVTRLDLTCNYSTGSEENAKDFLRWLSTQQDNRVKTGVYGETATVDFGRGSTRIYHKVYNKYLQLFGVKESHVSSETLEWVRSNGIVRHEVTLKSQFLRDAGLRFLGVLDMATLYFIYKEKSDIISRAQKVDDGFGDLPNHLRLTVRDYLAGESFKGSRAKFYRHRRDLLPYGIDIAIPSKIKQFIPRVKVITLQPVSAPTWYWPESVAA